MMALVTGGASCGKSAFAEQLCMQRAGRRVYLAAMRPFGEEGARRVRKHREQRVGKGFETIECYDGLTQLLADERIGGSVALLECLGNVVANFLFDGQRERAFEGEGDVDAARDLLVRDLSALADRCDSLIIVGNEVGSDGVSHAIETELYQHVLGAVTVAMARRCSLVVECQAGIPLVLKASSQADANLMSACVAGAGVYEGAS